MGYFKNTTAWGGGRGIMAAHDAHASSLPFSLLLFPLTAQTKRTRLKEHFLSQCSRSRLLTAYASLVSLNLPRLRERI